MLRRMTQCELPGVVVAVADGRECDQRRELRAPEGVARWPVVAAEVDISKRAGFAIAVALRGPLIVVDRVRRAFAVEVVVRHLRKDIFEILDGWNVLQHTI